MRPRSSSALLLLLATAIVAAACAVSPDSSDSAGPAAPVPTSLRDAKINPDFTFASTRAVTIQIAVDPTTLQGAKPFPLEIWNTKNELLIQAKVPSNGAFSADFPLPLGEHQLLIKLGDQEQHIAVGDDNLARTTFH